ncbi:Venom protein [Armadillidium nasatum]|uniref:Venom protein n=1 Tax=Armadillidium nasatum TaxID=96803 RepID=A0A5N5TJ29_9CRUS|nr:Venom protein [Armadillidium nasatum]
MEQLNVLRNVLAFVEHVLRNNVLMGWNGNTVCAARNASRKKTAECGLCNTSECLSPQSCPNGVGKDQCGCCNICLKDLRESCGGPNDEHGSCGQGLYCDESNGAPGTCQAWFLETDTPHVG